MNRTQVRSGGRAFTLVELVVVIAVIAVLVGLLLPSLARAKQKALRINCVSHLKNFGLSMRIFSSDNRGRFPMHMYSSQLDAEPALTAPDVLKCFQSLSNELSTPILLVCASDKRKPAPDFARMQLTNVSYFLGLDATERKSQSLLAGDRNLMTNGVPLSAGIVILTAKSEAGWTPAMHNRRGNVALADGSVQQFANVRLKEFVSGSRQDPIRLAIP